jgi:electron transport complex protein RnfC
VNARLADFHGGLVLPRHKEAADATAADCPLPAELVLPLATTRGARAVPRVAVGDAVASGQCIADGGDDGAVPVHAPAAGRIVAIEDRPVPHPSALPDRCIVLATDPSGPRIDLPALSPHEADPAALRARLHEAGLVGLGGGAFPTAAKLARAVDTVIVNGAECEPYIACDHVLLRDHADDVIAGAMLVARIAGAGRAIVAIEDSMQVAHAALAAALAARPDAADGRPTLELVVVPTRYPAGGERQLIRVLTGREVPADGLPADLGVVCINVATVAAAWRAVVDGTPLITRLVSVAGRGVHRPGTFRVAIGTPVGDLIAAAGGYTDHARRLVMGGPLMGLALATDAVPVVKATNSILVLGDDELRAPGPELPCIRCAECARVCPASLLPQELHWQLRAGDLDEARALRLDACIECGLCALVCPSQIPLVAWYRHGKTELRLADEARRRAETARVRHDARAQRLAREAEEQATRLAARRAEIAAKANLPASPSAEGQPADPPADPVAAALARARARRQQVSSGKPQPDQQPDTSSAAKREPDDAP